VVHGDQFDLTDFIKPLINQMFFVYRAGYLKYIKTFVKCLPDDIFLSNINSVLRKSQLLMRYLWTVCTMLPRVSTHVWLLPQYATIDSLIHVNKIPPMTYYFT